ncbi:MAG TPA: lytic transglycosylase domain-containing protein [Allosphingosinicella sp.]
MQQYQPQQSYQPPYQPAYQSASPRISSAIERWSSLRQSDNFSFSSYASFLTSYRGWPGEAGMRRSAERAIDLSSSRPGEVTSFFRIFPPLTPTGHARHALALQAEGNVSEARAAARRAWTAGYLLPQDESQLMSVFGSSLTPQDHDDRIAALLDSQGTDSRASAQRLIGFASPSRRAVFETRIALQTNAPDAESRYSALGSAGAGDAGVIMDRADWLRRGSQSVAARSLLAQPRSLSNRPQNVEKWYETLLTYARGAAADRNWSTAYQIASQVDDAYAPGVKVIERSEGERDDYTSLTWLAGTTALQQLNRPSDAVTMFLKYARGGRSTQVLTKGLYWAGRSALQAGQMAQAMSYFEEAARHPELFYGQLALERLGRTVPAPAATPIPTEAERAAFRTRDLVEATRTLGLMGRHDDQSLFVRALSAQVETQSEKALAMELARSMGRQDLGVWVARNSRNSGNPFYVQGGYPEARVPASQSHLWSLAHGIIRQESSFDRAAVSHMGARGMMQLMLPTAREEAGKIGVGYDPSRLTRDPDYNVMLGSHYFERLLNQWGGNTALAVASYNAGAGNVRKWVNANGDPRMPGVDIVRWIEEIPFSETKGYVQRVLENAVVYDALNPSRARAPERTRLSYYLGKNGRPG